MSNKDFYKFIIDALVNAKINADPSFEENLEKFASKLDSDIALTNSIQSIEKDIHLISKRIHFLDKKIIDDAKHFYAGISNQNLQKRLILAHENMSLFAKIQNTKSACKYLIVQAELLCNHLSTEAKIIDWVIKQTPSNINYVPASATSNAYLSTWNLLKAVDRRFQIQFNEAMFYEIKNIRDYESHGYHESIIANMEILLTKITKDWNKYLDEGTRFLDKLITEYYNYP